MHPRARAQAYKSCLVNIQSYDRINATFYLYHGACMLPQQAKKRIARLRRRCNLAIFVGLLLRSISVYLVIAGVFTLIIRLFWPGANPYLYLLLPGAVLPMAVALLWFRRRRYRDADVEGISDRRADLGGLLLTLSVQDDALWEEKLSSTVQSQTTKLPQLRYTMFLRTLPYLTFLVLTLVVPQRVYSEYVRGVSALEYEELKTIEQQLEFISEEDLLTDEQSDRLKEEVERMLSKTEQSHESRWEAIDALKEKISAEMEDVSRSLSNAERAAATGNREQLAKALMDLAQKGLLGELPAELANKLGPGAESLLRQGSLPNDPASLEALREYIEALSQAQCRKVCQGGLCGGSCGICGTNLDDFEIAGQGFALAEGPEADGLPGRGGINRGRGDAPMLWGDESDEQRVKFTPQELPPISISPDEDIPVVGINIIEPEEMEAPLAGGAGRVLDFNNIVGSEAWQRRISPRHRGLVRRYFSGGNAD